MKKISLFALSLMALNSTAIAQQKETKKAASSTQSELENEDDEESTKPKSLHPFFTKSYQKRNSGSFHANSKLISLGIGYSIISTTDVLDNVFSLKYPMKKMAGYYFKYEAAVSQTMGLSFNLGYANQKENQVKLYDANNNYLGSINDFNSNGTFIASSLLLNYHFNKLIPSKKVDLYIGAGIGARYFRYTYNAQYENLPLANGAVYADYVPNGYHTTKVSLAARAGIRYYLSPSIGLNIDYGYDRFAYGNFGLTFNLNPNQYNKKKHSQGTTHGSKFNSDKDEKADSSNNE